MTLGTVHRYATVGDFLAEAQAWLAAAEADNNLLLSVALVLTTADHPFRDPLYFAAIKRAGQILGCAVCAPPDGIEVGSLPAGAALQLLESVHAVRPDLPSVSGNSAAALAFARAWVAAYGGHWRVQYRARLFALEALTPPRPTAGRLRLADDGDAELLAAWAGRYAADIDTHVDVAAYFARLLRRRTMYVWDDDGPRCAVAESGSTPNGTRIAAVYTPDEHRSRGYASNAVAELSRRALARGRRFCVLFADERPARIYERLGYTALRDHFTVELSGTEAARQKRNV